MPNIDKSKLTDSLKRVYQVADNTFFTTPKDNPKDRIEIEVGDSKQVDTVFPQFKIKRWDNEVNFSVRLKDFTDYSVASDSEKIHLEDTKRKVDFYELPINKEYPEGGYEFEITLKEKPISNKIEFTINTKGLDFFYQPEITDDEAQKILDSFEKIKKLEKPKEAKDKDWQNYLESLPKTLLEAKRWSRPENIVGSYAVYVSENKANYEGGKEYRSGKVGHIPRPKIEDAEGNWVWGELRIDTDAGILSVTIPQDFLETAIYPVRHASGLTFGYTSNGATVSSDYYQYIFGSLFTGVSGTGTSISAYVWYSFINGTAGLALYKHSDLSLVTNGVTADIQLPASSPQWTTGNFSSSPTLSSSDSYVIVIWGKAPTSYIRYDTGSTDQGHERNHGTYSGSFPSTLTVDTHNTRKYSIYCTYTSAGSPSASVSPSGSQSPSASVSPSGSQSPSVSPSASVSPSSSMSPSRSPSSSMSPSVSPSASVSPSSSQSPSYSPSSSMSPSVSPSSSMSPSVSPSSSQSPSVSPSGSVSPSASISPSVSPSASISPSVSPSGSVSPSSSMSPSVSPSVSVSPSGSNSPSISQSASVSPSGSMSPSKSPSASVSPSSSPSPSQGITEYTKGEYLALPTDNNNLTTEYSAQEYIDVETKNNVRVAQSATDKYAVHLYKDLVLTANSANLECELQSNLSPTLSTVYLQIYNHSTDEWETVDSDNTTTQDTDFILTADIANLTNYKDVGNVISCRVYQLAI